MRTHNRVLNWFNLENKLRENTDSNSWLRVYVYERKEGQSTHLPPKEKENAQGLKDKTVCPVESTSVLKCIRF